MPIDATNPVPPTYPRRAGKDDIPEHIPQDLIRSLGIPVGPEFLADPHKFMAQLHETQPPIYYDVNPMGNAWQLTKHSDALFMLRHPEFFGNEGATPFPRDPDDYFYFIPIEIDPPHHRKYRKLLEPIFSPKGVLALEDKIRTLANDLIDEFIDKDDYYNSVYKLGNVVLIESQINQAVNKFNELNSNWFEKKQQEYSKSNVVSLNLLNHDYSIGKNTALNKFKIESNYSFESWNKQAIVDRQAILLELVFETWMLMK